MRDAYIGRGRSFALQKKYKRALEDFNKAITLDSLNAEAYSYRSNTYSHLAQFERAIQDADRALKLDPKSSSFYLRRGYAYQGAGYLDRAIADFTKAIELDPDAAAYIARMQAYLVKGDATKAEADQKMLEKVEEDEDKEIERLVNDPAFRDQGGRVKR